MLERAGSLEGGYFLGDGVGVGLGEGVGRASECGGVVGTTTFGSATGSERTGVFWTRTGAGFVVSVRDESLTCGTGVAGGVLSVTLPARGSVPVKS